MSADRHSSPWDRLSGLPVLVESYELDRLSARLANFDRVTTRIRLQGGGVDGRGEDVSPYEREDDTLHAAGPVLPLAGEWTLGSLCEHLAELDQWPVPPQWDVARRWRNWAFESAALDLALNQAGRALHEVIDREPHAVRFVNSLGLGEPPTFDPIRRRLERHPGLRFKLDATPEWTPELIDEVAATGAVEIIDFKGHYGLDMGELPPLLAMYEHVIGAFPDALLEDAHDLPEVAELLEPESIASPTTRRSTPCRTSTRRRWCRGAQHQAVPRRRPAIAVRRLRRLRGARPDHLWRRDGRAGRRPRPDPAAVLAVSRRTGRTTSPRAATTSTRRPPTSVEPAATDPAPTGFHRAS